MYAALAAVPTAIGLGRTWAPRSSAWTCRPRSGSRFCATFGLAITAKIVDYTNLQNAEILIGQCPCCETEIKQFFGARRGSRPSRRSAGVRHRVGVGPRGAQNQRERRREKLCEGTTVVNVRIRYPAGE